MFVTLFTPYRKHQFGQKLEQGDQMDQSIIVFIPVKKNVSVLLKLIVVAKVRKDESCRYFEKCGKWPMMIVFNHIND